MDKVYIVERRTWSSNEIIDVFKNKIDAEKFSNDMELKKAFSDGYQYYYVIEFEVK